MGSSDRDGTRRQVFQKLMSTPFSQETYPALFDLLEALKLLDNTCGKHLETVNFDPKHLIKRIRNCFLKASIKFGDLYLYNSDIHDVLRQSKHYTSLHTCDALMNPVDKHNVPLATDFVIQLCAALKDTETLKSTNT